MNTNYEEIGKEIGKLVSEKNKAYGDSFRESGKIVELLYPKGIPVEKYTSVLALVRILDKIQRLVTDPGYNGENSWADIAGYAILMLGYERQKTTKPDVVSAFDPFSIDGVLAKDPAKRLDEWENLKVVEFKTSGPVETCSMSYTNSPELRDSGLGGC